MGHMWLSDKLMNIKTLAITISLVVIVFVGGGNTIMTPPINAQQNLTSSSQSQNTTSYAAAEEKTYILVFGQRTIGNIDNSAKIVSSIVGNNSAKIQEEFLEEISLAPSQQLEEQINTIVNDGINGSSCNGISLTTQQGVSVSVDCIFTGDRVIWYVYPTP
jgi:predicted aldo/keto reductase-like oxidoreductase